ncbi:MAG: amidohydrolase family protein, partial [Candidatus Izemoplasmatales bacterium]|nr:amidohydrolase family protein [Candidatus Izemoplasmatales bacterium]
MDKRKLLKVAKGEVLADLVIKNAKIINVFSKTVDKGNIAISDGIIVGVGDYSGKKEVDALGYYIAPGFIDGHVHIESSMLIPSNYAKAVMARGTTSVIADCHEIANVCGRDGIDFMLASSAKSPLDVYMMIPSCVPSTEYETSGARLLAKEIKTYLKYDKVIGLGEMMDYPGAINGKED